MTHYQRARRHGDPSIIRFAPGRKPMEEPGYSAIHARLRKERGPASDYRCDVCRERAADWALTAPPDDPYLRVDPRTRHSGVYSLNLASYTALCRKHHIELDGSGFTHKKGSAS